MAEKPKRRSRRGLAIAVLWLSSLAVLWLISHSHNNARGANCGQPPATQLARATPELAQSARATDDSALASKADARIQTPASGADDDDGTRHPALKGDHSRWTDRHPSVRYDRQAYKRMRRSTHRKAIPRSTHRKAIDDGYDDNLSALKTTPSPSRLPDTSYPWPTKQQKPPPGSVGDYLRTTQLVLFNTNIYFDYVADAVREAFDELGIPLTVSTSIEAGSNATYILFLTHNETIQMPRNYISYNFEQLTTDKAWPPSLFERFRRAKMVWDYSLENIRVLKAHGVHNTLHVPLGYSPSMENTLPPVEHRDVDVMFVGAMNAKRTGTLRQLTPAGSGFAPLETCWKDDLLVQQLTGRGFEAPLKTVITQTCWGDHLLELYRRSKLSLNVHAFGGRSILEVHRILPLLVSKVLVLSEHSDDAWWDHEYGRLVNFTSAGSLREDVASMLQVDVEKEAERRYQRLLECCRYSSYFHTAFARPLIA